MCWHIFCIEVCGYIFWRSVIFFDFFFYNLPLSGVNYIVLYLANVGCCLYFLIIVCHIQWLLWFHLKYKHCPSNSCITIWLAAGWRLVSCNGDNILKHIHRSICSFLHGVGYHCNSWFLKQGSVSVSMSLFQSRMCFVCSHLTSGQKEGAEQRRNSDVYEIIRRTCFSSVFDTDQPQTIPSHE